MMKKILTGIFIFLFFSTAFSQVFSTADEAIESGNIKYENEDYEGAMADYTEATELDPEDPAAWFNLGLCEAKLEQYGSAISDFSYAIELDSLNAKKWCQRGMTREKEEYADEDEVIADYSKALELDPTLLLARYQRGRFYLNTEYYEDAITDLTAYIDASGDMLAEALYLRAAASNRLQFYDYDPMVDLEKAAGLGKRDQHVIYEVGYRHWLEERWDKGIEAFSKVIEKDAKYKGAWRLRGLCKIGLLDKTGGCEDLHQAAALGSDAALEYINEHCK